MSGLNFAHKNNSRPFGFTRWFYKNLKNNNNITDSLDKKKSIFLNSFCNSETKYQNSISIIT